MRYHLLAFLGAALLLSCERSSPTTPGQAAPSGLPQGELPPPAAGRAAERGSMPAGGANADPHAGLDVENPHGDPHGGGMGMANPHGGAPATAVDPKMVLAGTIEVAPKLKEVVKAGDVMFLSVKSVDESGTPQRIPIAADRQDVSTFPAAFTLSGANTMMQGTKFEGDVLITVRIDRDGEAMTRAKGDLEGSVRARIPQKGLKIVLDTPVP
jgi:hypothetical protein